MEIPHFDSHNYQILRHPFNQDIYLVSNNENFSAIFDFEQKTRKKFLMLILRDVTIY